MIYIIAGSQEEADKYVKDKHIQEKTLFIPDSEFSMVYKSEIPTVIFVGSYRNRRDILDRFMESRDMLLAKIASLEKKLIYDDDDNLVTQGDYNELMSQYLMYREYTR